MSSGVNVTEHVRCAMAVHDGPKAASASFPFRAQTCLLRVGALPVNRSRQGAGINPETFEPSAPQRPLTLGSLWHRGRRGVPGSSARAHGGTAREANFPLYGFPGRETAHHQTSRQGVNITTRDMNGSMDMKEASLTDAWASLRPAGCTTPGTPPPAPGPTLPRKVLRLGLCTGLAILATTGRRARSGDLSATGDSPADPRTTHRRTWLPSGEALQAEPLAACLYRDHHRDDCDNRIHDRQPERRHGELVAGLHRPHLVTPAQLLEQVVHAQRHVVGHSVVKLDQLVVALCLQFPVCEGHERTLADSAEPARLTSDTHAPRNRTPQTSTPHDRKA